VAGPGVPCQNLLTVRVLCWLSFFLFDFCACCIVDSLWVIYPCVLGWCSDMFPVGGLCVLGTWVVGCPGWLHRAWEAMFCIKSFIVIFPVFYMCRSLWCSSYSCGSISSYICFLGAFVPVVFTTPCPSFHRGKTAPGGGCGSSRDAVVWLSLVQQQISLNLEPDFGSGSQIFMNLNLNSREPDFRSSSGSSRVWT